MSIEITTLMWDILPVFCHCVLPHSCFWGLTTSSNVSMTYMLSPPCLHFSACCQAYSAALQTQWQWVTQLCVCVEQHLKDNTAYFQVRQLISNKHRNSSAPKQKNLLLKWEFKKINASAKLGEYSVKLLSQFHSISHKIYKIICKLDSFCKSSLHTMTQYKVCESVSL